MTETPSPNSLLKWFAEHPIVGITGWLAGLLGLVLSVLFYVKAMPTRQVSILEPSLRSVFVHADSPTVLDVRVHGNKVEKQDVYSVQFAIWSSGNQSIRPENVLSPLKFVATDGNKIVDAQLIRKSHDICGITVAVASDGSFAQVDWKILEPLDGAVVQLVLVGNREGRIGATGIIEGSRKPFFVRVAGEAEKGPRDIWSDPTSTWQNKLFAIGIGFFCGAIAYRFLFVNVSELLRRRAFFKSVLMALFGLMFGFIAILMAASIVLDISWNSRVPRSLLTDDVVKSAPASPIPMPK